MLCMRNRVVKDERILEYILILSKVKLSLVMWRLCSLRYHMRSQMGSGAANWRDS